MPVRIPLTLGVLVVASTLTAFGHDGFGHEAQEAPIQPGVPMTTNGRLCTSDFLFTDGLHYYLGYAAHCAATAEKTQTNGCEAPTPDPLGTPVKIGDGHMGLLAYSSWATMQAVGETRAHVCDFNDFALVRIDLQDHDDVSPQVRHFGGPTAMAYEANLGDHVLSYGHTSLRPSAVIETSAGRGRIDTFHEREGHILTADPYGWSYAAYLHTPGLPGDSGSPVLTGDGRALGILVTVGLAPYPASNYVTSLAAALHYANQHLEPDVRLVTHEHVNHGMLTDL